MHRIDSDTAVSVMPAPAPAGAPGYFTRGNPGPGTPVPATNFTPEFCNAVQEEFANVIEAAGITLDKTKNDQLLAALRDSGIFGRKRLQADTTVYVATTGNDATGDGSNAAPWATIQHAWNTIQNEYDLNGHAVIIQLADGDYAGATFVGGLIGARNVGSLVLNGNAETASNVTVGALIVGAITGCTVQHYKMTGTTGIQSINGGQVSIGPGMIVAATGNAFYATNQGLIFIDNSYTTMGNKTGSEWLTLQGAIYLRIGITVTFSGTPAYGSAVLSASVLGLLFIGSGTVTFTGAVIGTSYLVSSNSVGVISGNTIPGSTGSTSDGGRVV